MEKISIKNASFRNGSTIILPHTTWTIHDREHWAILGPNGAGKSTLVKALWGGTSLASGTIEYPCIDQNPVRFETLRQKIGYVSFELHQNVIKHEALLDEMREYSGTHDQQTTVRMLIQNNKTYPEKVIHSVAQKTGVIDLLEQPIRTLSSGQMRKTLIARALVKKPEFLILDEPYDSLDAQSRKDLEVLLPMLQKETQIILVTHRIEEIHPGITHVLMVENGRVQQSGRKAQILTSSNLQKLYGVPVSITQENGTYRMNYQVSRENNGYQSGSKKQSSREVISFHNVSLLYGQKTILNNLTWTVHAGENWLIKGENGCGKSTIVQLITGDNMQVFAKDIRIFGERRGQGTSLWELKQRIGIVSGEVQLRPQAQQHFTVEECILSGFFQSFGLYRRATEAQKAAARSIACKLGCNDLLNTPYAACSNGQKRIALIARALVHTPDLLILDEPCHGLDIPSRYRVLSTIQKLTQSSMTLLMTTHHDDEVVPGIDHVLQHNPENNTWSGTLWQWKALSCQVKI